MDVNVLQNLVEDDASSGKTPTIVIAYAGNNVGYFIPETQSRTLYKST